MGHLKRIFKEYALTGIHEYFLAIKIGKAKVLLSQGETVNKVAEAIGFYNPNYFSSSFKRITGVTPTQWLKILNKTQRLRFLHTVDKAGFFKQQKI